LILYVAITNVLQATEAMKEYGDVAPKPPLYGIYNVEYFIRNNDTIAPLATDTTRWKKLIVSYPEYSFVQFMNDSTKGFAFKLDTIKKRIEIFSYNDTTKKSNLVYSFSQKNILLLTGKLDSNSVVIKMRKYDFKNFRLINRGFHWVNEYPYNR